VTHAHTVLEGLPRGIKKNLALVFEVRFREEISEEIWQCGIEFDNRSTVKCQLAATRHVNSRAGAMLETRSLLGERVLSM
jgi:hypothetical protein